MSISQPAEPYPEHVWMEINNVVVIDDDGCCRITRRRGGGESNKSNIVARGGTQTSAISTPHRHRHRPGPGRNLAPSSVAASGGNCSGLVARRRKVNFFFSYLLEGKRSLFFRDIGFSRHKDRPPQRNGGLAQSRFVVNRGSKILYLIKRGSSAVDK